MAGLPGWKTTCGRLVVTQQVSPSPGMHHADAEISRESLVPPKHRSRIWQWHYWRSSLHPCSTLSGPNNGNTGTAVVPTSPRAAFKCTPQSSGCRCTHSCEFTTNALPYRPWLIELSIPCAAVASSLDLLKAASELQVSPQITTKVPHW